MMRLQPRLFALPGLLFIVAFLTVPATLSQVQTGADHLFSDELHLIAGKRVGLVTNHTGVRSDGTHLADALHEHPAVTLVALFGPEHGVRGTAAAGEVVGHGKDEKTGVPAYSLYGAIRKPTRAMLSGIDVLLYDIQDVGVRFYTYISTLSLIMEAAAEQDIPVIVLDRPNPIRGTWIDGFIRDDSLRSFVGLHPVPIVYGMTAGELATLYNEEGWLENGIRARLTVVRMKGWTREQWYDQTGLAWIAPSPNIPALGTATVYPGTCLIEGTNLSEGRGTDRPFEYITAPYVSGDLLASQLNALQLPGVVFQPVEVVPKDIPGVAMNTKHKGEVCRGVFVKVVDRDSYEPLRAAVHLISTVRKLYPDQFRWRPGSIDRLSGTPRFRKAVDEGQPAEEIIRSWHEELEAFRAIRAKYLLY